MVSDSREIWPDHDNPGTSMHIFFGDKTIAGLKADEWHRIWKAYADITRIMSCARMRQANRSSKLGTPDD